MFSLKYNIFSWCFSTSENYYFNGLLQFESYFVHQKKYIMTLIPPLDCWLALYRRDIVRKNKHYGK